MIEADILLNTAARGMTKPKFFHCSDNQAYLIKFNHPTEWNRILFNEFVSYHLAEYCGLPMPKMELINVSPELCAMYNNIEGLTPGIKVGFLKEEIEDNHHSSGILKEPYITAFKKVDNKEIFPSMIAFDAFIHNRDRTGNDGNFILTFSGYNSYFMKVIDHGHALMGPSASPQRLVHLRSFRDVQIDPIGIVYEAVKNQIDLTTGINPFINIINRIESIHEQTLINIFRMIPNSWGINTTEKEAVVRFLLERKLSVKILLNNLVNGGYFPYWNKEGLSWQGLHASSL
ncbi:hypothetical protein IHV12_15075 [Fictibacillus sp. 7GRE50]|uniref:HipA family kinase n=1 Tax=Fictibacillus sp. 7GRE50 TaxID=2745878 RepID=UPI0018CF22CD|nr:HipA family kinase [Fictibacillus sp. 7GRE50]MBH0166244.1 hypothetical protein [Fictibacillus sp. 7GRE50]